MLQQTVLSLRIAHPKRDLAIVCRKIGLKPKVIWKQGDERRTPKGRRIGGTRDSSYCLVNLGSTTKVRLRKKIEAALRRLKPHKILLRNLFATGGRVSFSVGWFCDENTGDELDADLLEGMADLRMKLELFIYVRE